MSLATNGDTIDLAAGTYQPASDTSFTISTSITVQPTTTGSTIILDGNGASVLGVNSSVTAVVSGVTIENGAAVLPNLGGGVYNDGTLTVADSTLSGNSSYEGGGILNTGTLTVEDSTFSGNTGDSYGGGIYNEGTLTVADSTISGNTATNGGGGIQSQGTLTVADSTISGNTNTIAYYPPPAAAASTSTAARRLSRTPRSRATRPTDTAAAAAF